jgi:hypothetical protein
MLKTIFFGERQEDLLLHRNLLSNEFRGLKHDATISSAEKRKRNKGPEGITGNNKGRKIPDNCAMQR